MGLIALADHVPSLAARLHHEALPTGAGQGVSGPAPGFVGAGHSCMGAHGSRRQGSILSSLGAGTCPAVRVSCTGPMTAEVNPDLLSKRLVGLAPPSVKLPWVVYEDQHGDNMLGSHSYVSLADLAVRHLAVYFFPTEDVDDPTADILCNAFRDCEYALIRMAVLSVGISAQTALEQMEMASANLLPFQLSDEHLQMASELKLPTKEVDGRHQYEPLILAVIDGRIERVFFPVWSAMQTMRVLVGWFSDRLHDWVIDLARAQARPDAQDG